MMHRMLDALAILLFGVGLVRAQEPRNHSLATPGEVVPQAEKIFIVPAAVYEVERAAPYRPAAITTVDFRDSSSVPSNVSAEDFKEPRPTDGFRFWARGEYLLWRVTGAPVAVPLVTTNNPPAIGALNEPGTTVLFGAGSGPDVNFGKFSGGRVTIGAWLEDDHEYSLEATAFLLQRRGFLFSASTVGGGAQVVSIPFNATDPFNGNPAGESALNAGAAPSSATVYLASRLFGGELNETIHLWSTETFYWSTLLGFRYVGLREELTLTHSSHDAGNSGTLSVNDAYATRSQFYGGQLGTRFGMSVGRFGLETAVKVAVGSSSQVVNINGNTIVTNGAFGFANGTTIGGLFALPSNIGTTGHMVFAVVPELTFKASVALTPRIRSYVAYQGLYVSNAARPGNQIDRTINPNLNPFFVPPGNLVGTAAPLATTIRESSLWAQGLQVGLEIRY
ncbi:MAG: hypothetical protein EXR98_21160 [Gemmataceae bacterium]|nr:hypothetical protein [Gemmataceae bacterium]